MLLGRRTAGSEQFEVRLHLAYEGGSRRVVKKAEGFAMGSELAVLVSGEQTAPTESGPVAAVVPSVDCHVVTDGVRVRAICICYTNDSTGVKPSLCFDWGWKD